MVLRHISLYRSNFFMLNHHQICEDDTKNQYRGQVSFIFSCRVDWTLVQAQTESEKHVAREKENQVAAAVGIETIQGTKHLPLLQPDCDNLLVRVSSDINQNIDCRSYTVYIDFYFDLAIYIRYIYTCTACLMRTHGQPTCRKTKRGQKGRMFPFQKTQTIAMMTMMIMMTMRRMRMRRRMNRRHNCTFYSAMQMTTILRYILSQRR